MDNQIGFFYGLYVWFLAENNLEDDSENITIARLRNFCESHIHEDDHQRYKEIITQEESFKKTSYLETFFEIVSFINLHEDHPFVEKESDEFGQGGLWMLAEKLTDEFEQKYSEIVWGEELDWYDTIDQFLNQKFKTV